jgi:hypothetical protein
MQATVSTTKFGIAKFGKSGTRLETLIGRCVHGTLRLQTWRATPLMFLKGGDFGFALRSWALFVRASGYDFAAAASRISRTRWQSAEGL